MAQYTLRYRYAPYAFIAEGDLLDTVLEFIADSTDPNDLINDKIEQADPAVTVDIWEEAGDEFYVQQTLPTVGTQFEFHQNLPAAKQKVRIIFAADG